MDVEPVPRSAGVPAVAETVDGEAGGSDAEAALGPLGGPVSPTFHSRRGGGLVEVFLEADE